MMSKKQIRDAKIVFSDYLRQWVKMTDAELFAALKEVFPACEGATRDECLQYLVNIMVDRLFPDR